MQDLRILARHAQQRGQDASGLMFHDGQGYEAVRADYRLKTLLDEVTPLNTGTVMGHSRLVTNGMADNQPVFYDEIGVLHNGIVVNADDVWSELGKPRKLEIDSEVIAAIAAEHLESGGAVEELAEAVLTRCQGTVACAVAIVQLGKLVLFSNNGSLYLGEKDGQRLFASEAFALQCLGCTNIVQVRAGVVVDIPVASEPTVITDRVKADRNLIPSLIDPSGEERQLRFTKHDLRRCTRCILPETMPFIEFDDEGVCNYCRAYTLRNRPKPQQELFRLVQPYRTETGAECIVPLSGGRDSCFALHLVVNELQMRPVTFTYDWGMVTDLGRRNISRICAALGVENIVVADDISRKRQYIAANLRAWLKSPHLGMISLLTAGDKHFFRHLETVKKQTGVDLNLWGINPLEVTHFKAGFLGVPPDFAEDRVYSHGALKQLRYHSLRFRTMMNSPGYFNSSLWDTLSGEYYRSFAKKTDYYHLFDYWRWDEGEIDGVLDEYGWEKAPDTRTTWRIGDGTAAFYNYVYYTVAGFTEHDTFRSNQIREGDLSRDEALAMVMEENRPRYQNIKWYLDVLGFDFGDVIGVVNNIPTMYES